MALELRGIHKRFGKVHANAGIDLVVEPGTLHGLLGENGAGKSTLMKILSGFIKPDAGTIRLDGNELHLRSPRDAIAAGIGMLHQDPLVFLPFPVVDNFILGSPGPMRIDRAAAATELEEVASRFGFSFDPNALARTLTVGERQQLEITRLLWLGARVLIFDEPTTGISATQREQLFATLRRLAAEGLIVIFVSHKLEEVEALCDSVTVLRQGRVVGEATMPVPEEELVRMMFGKPMVPKDRPPADIGPPALRIEALDVAEGPTHLTDLTLDVGAGEVIGLAGLEGSGQRTLLRAIAGLVRPRSGRIVVGDDDVAGLDYRARLRAGIHYLPAGRLEEGLVAGLDITEHFLLTRPDTRFFIDWDEAREEAFAEIQDNFIKGFPDSPVESLSGGNQQRLLLAMLPERLRVLLMEHPTRGLDIESAEFVWSRLLDRRAHGTAIVFASADLDELLRYSDRVAVFFNGRVLKIVDAAATDVESLGYLIGGRERV